MDAKASVVPLNEDADIYMVIDESGKTLGTGTKEVCEVLASLMAGPKPPAAEDFRTALRNSRQNIRSAIKI
jgi:hypothetical protein